MSNDSDFSPQQVHDALQAGTAILVDIREPAEHAADHIEGAVLKPMSELRFSEPPVETDLDIILHCKSGGRSGTALSRFKANGATITGHMAGGILAWKAKGLPVVTGSEVNRPDKGLRLVAALVAFGGAVAGYIVDPIWYALAVPAGVVAILGGPTRT